MYHIDVRLSSELVKDNVVPRAKHVIPFGPEEHRSGIRVGHDVWSRERCRSLSREQAGCEEWAALSEELADLQASSDEETRRLTDLFRTGCRPPTRKRQPNLQERSSVSNVKTSHSDPWNVAWPSDTHRRLEVLGGKTRL